ncbi:MAG: CHASE2 domain-containing protein [Elusimicrobiales bacterium]
MITKGRRSVYITATAMTLFFIIFYFVDFILKNERFISMLETKWFDFKLSYNNPFARILGSSPKDADKRILIAAIDEKTISRYGWPFPRRYYSTLIENLIGYGVKIIAFDVMFFDPDRNNPQSDEIFAKTVRKYSDRIILAVSIDENFNIKKPFDLLHKSAVNFGSAFAGDMMDYDGNIRKIYPFIPLPVFYNGFEKNFYYLDICHQCPDNMKGIGIPTLGTMAYIRYSSSDIFLNFQKWKNKRFYINFRKPLKDKSLQTVMYKALSVVDIIEKKLGDDEKKLLKDSVVFVGSTSQGAFDHYSTPVSIHTPGVEIHALCIDNLLNDDYLRGMPWYLDIILLVFFIWLPVILLKRSVIRIVIFNFIPIFFIMLLSMWLVKYHLNHLFMAFFFPNAVSFVYIVAYKSIVEDRQKRWIKNTFSQYLSPEVVDILVKDPSKLKLGGERREVTVLFMDIAGFTSMSEKMSPEEVTNILNFYLSSLSDIILEEKGVIDKYIGDCIMAFWNAPVDVERHRAKAIRSAIRCVKEIERLNANSGMPSIKLRFGINSGYAVVGNMGSSKRFSYTVLGDTVNLASRLEGANKFFGTSIIASIDTVSQCKDEIVFKYIGRILVVGKSAPVEVYEPFKLKDEMKSCDYEFMKNFENGIKYFYEKSYDRASVFFEKALSINPYDGLSVFYKKFSCELKEGREGFDGIFNIRNK